MWYTAENICGKSNAEMTLFVQRAHIRIPGPEVMAQLQQPIPESDTLQMGRTLYTANETACTRDHS